MSYCKCQHTSLPETMIAYFAIIPAYTVLIIVALFVYGIIVPIYFVVIFLIAVTQCIGKIIQSKLSSRLAKRYKKKVGSLIPYHANFNRKG